jgi:hypothetical protein
MEELLESIRTGISADALPQARGAAAAACRTILTALEAMPGQPLAASPINASQIATVVGALRGVPPDQLLDLTIAKLRAALPADAHVPRVEPLKFHLIQLPGPGAKP